MEAEPVAPAAAASVPGPGPAPPSRAVSATTAPSFRDERTYALPKTLEDGQHLLGTAGVDRQRVAGEPGGRGRRGGRIGERLTRIVVERRIVEVAGGDVVPRECVDGRVT